MTLNNNNCKKRLFWLLALLTIFGLRASAQIMDPVKWSYGAKKTGKNEAVIFLKATIDDGWHIYSTKQKDGGPVKTTFTETTGNTLFSASTALYWIEKIATTCCTY